MPSRAGFRQRGGARIRFSPVKRAKSSANFVPTALLLLNAYGEIKSSSMDPPIWWERDDAWLKSQSRKRLIEFWHLPEYWRKHGFPPQCRPISESDFECL